jgi:putative ABC transport system permease protein
MVLRYGLSFVVRGLTAGVGVALVLLPVIREIPAGQRFDPVAVTVAAFVLLIVAAVSCLVPALRAARVDPVTVLRDA